MSSMRSVRYDSLEDIILISLHIPLCSQIMPSSNRPTRAKDRHIDRGFSSFDSLSPTDMQYDNTQALPTISK